MKAVPRHRAPKALRVFSCTVVSRRLTRATVDSLKEEENPSVSGVLGHDTLLSKKERFEEPTIYLHRAHRSTRSAVNPLLQTGTD